MMKATKRPTKMVRHNRQPETRVLRLSPTAWAKLLYLRDLGDTEIGAFGISAADDLLYVENIELVRQTCDVASVAFDDNSVADFFDRQVDAGRRPEQVGRIWAHTHPGSCPNPSATDEGTFARVFGRTEWAVIFITARGGQTYARMQFHVGPGGSLLLPVEVDYRRPFAGSDHAGWQAEYLANVQARDLFALAPLGLEPNPLASGFDFDQGLWDAFFEDELAGVPPTERPRSVSDDRR